MDENMTKYKGKLRSKDEEIDCECEGKDIEKELSEYQIHMMKCMHGFIPGGRSIEENKKRMTDKFKSCAAMWSGSRVSIRSRY